MLKQRKMAAFLQNSFFVLWQMIIFSSVSNADTLFKLVRYGPVGSEKSGLIDKKGVLRDLSQVFDDIGPETLNPS